MNLDQLLDNVAKRYLSQGYQVVAHPESKDLPDFAKAFKVEFVARRTDGSAIVSAKKNLKELQNDPDLANLAEIIEKHPEWRLDVVVLSSSSETKMPEKFNAKEPSEEDFQNQFAIVQELLATNFNQQAFVIAWSVLEAAMRRRLLAEGEDAGWGTSARTMMNQLLSAGDLSFSVFRELEELYQSRSAIVHGFTMPIIQPIAVDFILTVARNLLEESKQVQQPV